MLITDDTNRRDAIDTVGSLLSLVGDLMASRAPGTALSLSNQSANGLDNILTLVGDILEEANCGLIDAAKEVEALKATVAETEADSRRNFNLGYAAGLSENDLFVGSGDARLAGIRVGLLSGYYCGWGDAGGDMKKISADHRNNFIDEVMASYATDEASKPQEDIASSFVGFAPVLTESVRDDVNRDGAHDELRRSA